jgi:hypothetical protein
MYELDYPNYISSLDEGVENSQTISIGDSLSYEKFSDEYINKLKKDFKKYSNNLTPNNTTFLSTFNVSESTLLNKLYLIIHYTFQVEKLYKEIYKI